LGPPGPCSETFGGGGNTQLRRYIHGPQQTRPLVWYDLPFGNPVRKFLSLNGRGSVIAVTDSGQCARHQP